VILLEFQARLEELFLRQTALTTRINFVAGKKERKMKFIGDFLEIIAFSSYTDTLTSFEEKNAEKAQKI
jgi:hypothetical protein